FQLDNEWRFRYLNSHAERLLGATRDDLVGEVVWEAFPAAVGSDFERRYRGAAESGEPVSFDAYYPHPLDAWYEVRAWPNPDGLAVYFVDVTARYHAQEQVTRTARRSALVAHVTEQLTGTLDVGEAVARLGALLVPDLGDWCVATLVQDPGREGRLPALRDVGGWHRDPTGQALVERFAEVRLSHLADGSFLPNILASEQPIVASNATSVLVEIFEVGETCDLIRELAPEHVVVVSLRGRDRVVGLLTVLRSAERGPFTQDVVESLAEVADRAGLALDNARLFAEQRDLAEGLQRSMLTRPPQPDNLQIVVRYEAAAETAQVGGDWYDAFLQPEGSTVLVIGDVVGHDTAAAAAMGQVRSLLRGIAVFSGDGPADVLRGVDRALETLQVDTTATAVVARLEQTSGEVEQGVTRLRWSNAGHPPPVMLSPDGTVQLLDNPEPDLLLGLDSGADRTEQEVVVERGSTVLLFTDGLVERREEDLETGLERLRHELAHLAESDPPVDELCDRLLARMVPSRREDDIALVAVRLHPQDGPRPAEAGRSSVPAAVDPDAPGATARTVTARFSAEPTSIPEARRFVRRAVHARNPALVEDAALCATELATNAILHGEGTFIGVSVLLAADAVTIAVANEGSALSEAVVPGTITSHEGVAASDVADHATSGRGLGIVAELAESWDVETTFEGIRVWARLADEDPPAL
ncbi:MAG: SpoIIE family protein phosphatase, partial [Marmoricola sp.]